MDSLMVEATASVDTSEIDLDGLVDEATGIRYLGKATRVFDGSWRCLACVGAALCLVELRVAPTIRVDADPGDEDDRAVRESRRARALGHGYRRPR